jgi:hypothetical protein
MRALPWIRDFGFVGGVTGFLAPYVVLENVEYSLRAGVGGAVTGALLGLFTSALLSTRARRWPKLVLLPAGFAIGALWGMGAVLPTTMLLELSLIFGGAAGAVQLGWFWLAYSYRRVNLRSTWAVVLLASLLSGGLGYAGFGAMAVLRTLLT